MRPFEMNSKFISAWIDLDSIQVIHGVRVFPERLWGASNLGPAFFTIQYVGQNENRVISIDAPVDGDDVSRVYKDITALHETHDALVTAWTEKGPR